MMKIGVSGSSMNNRDYLSGSATPMVGFMKELVRSGHKVVWLEKNPDSTVIKFSPVPVIGFSSNDLRKLPKDLNLDLLIVQNWCFNPALLAKTFKSYGSKVFFWDDNTPYAIKRLLTAAPFVDKVLVHGDGAARILRDYIPWEKIEIFYFATDPDRFKPKPDARFQADVTFVGTNIKERIQALKQIFFEPSLKLKNHEFRLYGSNWKKWRHLKKFPVKYRGWISNENLHKAFANAKIAINATRRIFQSITCVPSNRIFDIMASGTVLLTDPIPGVEKLFKVGRELVVALDSRAAVSQIDYLLKNPEAAKEIARQGREAILKAHTWKHRIRQIGLDK